MSTILITGANGFIGSNLVKHCQKNGFNVLAGAREGSDLFRLDGLQEAILPLDYLDEEVLTSQLKGIEIDYLIHVAGVTVADSEQAYYEGNCTTTKNLLTVVGTRLKKFVLISSLAARGPGIDSIDAPISPYGKSKLEAEEMVRSSGLSSLIVRPAAVYGPEDLGFLPLFKWAKRGVIIGLGDARRKLAFIHVSDLCRLIVSGLSRTEEVIYGSDGKTYTLAETNATIKTTIGRKRYVVVSIPIWLFKVVMSVFGFFVSAVLRRSLKYPSGKVDELIASDWSIGIEERKVEAEFNLKDGFDDTVSFYTANGWL